jgi:hypothetical protein
MEIFYIQKKCFTLACFRRDAKFGKYFKLIQILLIVNGFYCNSMLAINVFVQRKDVMIAAESFGAQAVGLTGLTKILTFYFFMDKFYVLMEKLEKSSSNGMLNA